MFPFLLLSLTENTAGKTQSHFLIYQLYISSPHFFSESSIIFLSTGEEKNPSASVCMLYAAVVMCDKLENVCHLAKDL